MSRFNDYPDGANLLSDDLVVVSRRGRTFKLPGAALLGNAADADQFADFKQTTQFRLDAQTATINRLISYIEENGGFFPQPSFNILSLSSASFTAGEAFSAVIFGATIGSIITATADDGTILDVANGVVSGTFPTSGSKIITLVETLDGYSNSPNPTVIQVDVAEGGVVPTPGAIVIDQTVLKSGNNYTFTARRSENIANAETRSYALAGSSMYPPSALASDFGGAFPTSPINFLAGSATAAFTVTSATAQPE